MTGANSKKSYNYEKFKEKGDHRGYGYDDGCDYRTGGGGCTGCYAGHEAGGDKYLSTGVHMESL